MMQEIMKNTNMFLYKSNIQNYIENTSKYSSKDTLAKNIERSEKLLDELIRILEEKKIYLDPKINLNKLSLLLCTNTTYLSNIINRCFGCNLRTLINKYRIEHAKVLLKKEKFRAKELPQLCGFLSRSTFYSVFLKFEQITPLEYRQQYQSKEMMKQIEYNIKNRNFKK